VDRNAIVNTSADLTIYRSNLRASKYPYIDIGSESLVLDSDLESSSGLEAACLYASCDSPAFKDNRLVNGIRNFGASDVTTWKNTYQ